MTSNPTKQALREILNSRGAIGWNAMDEVFPGIWIGGEEAAKNVDNLRKHGITHVLNASYSAAGPPTALGVSTSAKYYEGQHFDCKFLGVPALDFPGFNITPYFEESVEFIESALRSQGKVLVHCFMGVSRSTTLVIVYLIMKKNMSAPEALKQIRENRNVFPNDGFLDQICDYEKRLNRID